MRPMIVLASLCTGAALVACGSSPSSPDAVAPAPDAFVSHFDATGTVGDAITGAPIFGATVCATGAPGDPCTTSAVDGTYSLPVSLPDGKLQIANVTTAGGYLGRELLIVEDPTPPQRAFDWETTGLLSTSDATTLLSTHAGFTYPTTTTGFVQIQIFGSPTGNAPAATATISPSSGSGPVYADADGTPDPALTATTPGTVGDVYFGNLAPGTYEITVTSPGLTCSVIIGDSTLNGEWPPAAGGTLSVGVSANALTSLLAVPCT